MAAAPLRPARKGASLRLAFMGSPEFAVHALHALLGAGHIVAAVYCQPPRPAGRGQAPRRCAVQVAADALGLPVRHPSALRHNPQELQDFRALDLDAAVVAAYGLILPQAFLDAPRRGCLNIHASLLPRWRGAAPIQAAVLAGDDRTGVTVMQMDAGLDTGAMLLAEATPIGPATTAAGLHDTLAAIGARLILRALAEPAVPVPQPAAGATYAAKLTRADGRIAWTDPAAAIDRRVRALNPWPGTDTLLAGTVLKIHAAEVAAGAGEPGTVLDDRLLVACGSGALRLTRIQLPGRAPLAAGEFLRGRPIAPGSILG